METNTMKYGFDGFDFRRQALLVSAEPFDTTYETSIGGFYISGTEPENARRRIIFRVDGGLWKFGDENNPVEYTRRGELDDILEYGNTVGELLALTNIPSWVGKKIYPIIALDAPADSPIMPRIKMELKVNSYNDVYTRNEISPVYYFKTSGDAAKIIDVFCNKAITGAATANVYIRLKNKFSEWGDWLEFENAIFKEAVAFQFKIVYILTTLTGVDMARVSDVTVKYSTDSEKFSGNVIELVTTPVEYDYDFGTCYALIRHSELNDAEIKAFVMYNTPPTRRENLLIGTGTGETQTLPLAVNSVIDTHVDQTTLHINVGGVNLSNFYFDTEKSTVTLTADVGKEIFATYDCGISDEYWREMEHVFTKQDGDIFASRFLYRLGDTKNKRISAVKFQITKNSFRVLNESIGTANGKTQMYSLPHRAIPETIKLNADWTYDEGAQILKATAPIGTDLVISYNWRGEMPQIFSYITGWTPAAI